MRPIKFRAWDKENNKMILELTPFSRLTNWDKGVLELMQFTGLLDKNGKEIYEGDIIGIDMRKFGGSAEEKFKVIWEDDGWALKDLSDDSLPAYIFHDKDRQEVIGNIYENPDKLANN